MKKILLSTFILAMFAFACNTPESTTPDQTDTLIITPDSAAASEDTTTPPVIQDTTPAQDTTK